MKHSAIHISTMRSISLFYYIIFVALVILSLNCVHTHRIARRVEKPAKLKFEIKISKGCDVIDFPNATLNECGFCVGGGTGLDQNYGKDCMGVCFGTASFDCQGVCGGNAYVDECTGTCTNPNDDESALISNTSSNRDCRGLCIQPTSDLASPAPVPSQVYSLDQCGICRLEQSPGFLSGVSSSFGQDTSHSIDCSGSCQLPGLNKFSIVCGQCVRQNVLSHVIDECGNCLSEGHPCSCDRDPTKCGCIDPNNCYVIKSISPAAIPSNVAANVSIMGYFYPYAKQLYCIVRRQGFETVESFPVQFLHKNKTTIQCNLQLTQKGEYVVGLGFRKNVFITPPKDLLQIFVFDSHAVNISLIGPGKSLTNDSESILSIEFEDETGEIPPVPLKCQVLYEDGQKEISNFGVKPNSCILKKSTLRSKSQVLKIYPTFDGSNFFPVYMEHLIESPAPRIFPLSSFVSEDGLAIVINFDKSVDLDFIDQNIKNNSDDDDDNTLVMCDYLLHENTIEHLSLFGLQSCKWATRIQLIITILRPLSSDSIEIQINPQVLVEFDQRYTLLNDEMSANISKLSNSLNWWSYEPMVAVAGPTEIPVCGEFALVGQFSSPRGTNDVEFRWMVNGEVSTELKQYVAANGRSTNLLLSADMFDTGLQYRFTFRAFIHARRQSLEATHTLTKLDYEAPIVSIYSTRLLHSLPLYESDNVTLVADVKVPECIYPPQRLVLFWRVTDPQFLFPLTDISKRYSVHFTVEPFSVPANHTSSVSLNSFIGFYQNQTSTSDFSFRMIDAPLKAHLANGINKITIGSKSGMIALTSRNDLRKRLVYQWSCHETKSAQPCFFNFASVPIGYQRNPILFTREMQTRANLLLNSSSFQPNNQYLIGLQVFDANNSKISSETEYTLLNVEEGVKPQVFVGPVYIKGKYVVPYNTRFSTFLIPSGTRIVIQGNAYLREGIKSIRWESKNFRYPLSWSSKLLSYAEMETQLSIHEDTLTAYGVYIFKLTACSHEDKCSSNEISLMAAQSVTMCNVMLESYVELELTLASIEKCNIPPSSSPITYQVYLEDDMFPTLVPVTAPQLSPVIIFTGTPAFTDNQLTRLAVRVCDRFDTCTFHYSQPIRVENTPNLTASIEQLVTRANRFYKTGDLFNSIAVLSSAFLKPDTFNESYMAFESAINATVEAGTSALQLPNLVLSSGHYELTFNTLSFALFKTSDYKLRSKLMDLIARFYDKAIATESMPTMNSIRITYSNVMNAFVLNEEQKRNNFTHDLSFLKDTRETFRKIKKAAAARMPLGSRVVLVAERFDDHYLDSEGLPVKLHTAITEIVHLNNPFDVNLRARLNHNQSVVAKVQFGEEVKQNFSSSWNCSQNMPCSSVVYSVTLFPNYSPYPSSQLTHKLSPVLDINIHAPNTGQEQNIRGLFKATVFELTVTGNESFGGSDYATKCHYFDEDRQEWRIDDVHPLGIAYNQAGCWAGHLSSFVVLRTVLSLNADYIIGVLVACMMGVLVFGMMLVFYVQRKRGDASVSPDNAKPIPNSTANVAAHPKANPSRNAKPRHRAIHPDDTETQTQTILVD